MDKHHSLVVFESEVLARKGLFVIRKIKDSAIFLSFLDITKAFINYSVLSRSIGFVFSQWMKHHLNPMWYE